MSKVLLKLTCYFFVFFIHFSLGFSQPTSIVNKLDPKNFPYYFRIGKEIWDIRDLRLVNNKIIESDLTKILLSPDKQKLIVVHANQRVMVYDTKGNLLRQIQPKSGDLVSTDATHVVFKKNNDLWSSQINWDTGTRGEEKQLTQLGLWPNYGGIGYSHWWRNKMIFYHEQACYLLNTLNGEITEFPSMCHDKLGTTAVSPTGRFLFENDLLYDLQLDRAFGLREFMGSVTGREFWTSDTTFVIIDATKATDQNTKKTIVVNAQAPFQVENPALGVRPYGDFHNYFHKDQDAKRFPPNGQYFLHLRPSADNQEYDIWLFDVNSGVQISTGLRLPHSIMLFGSFPLRVLWTTDGTFVYGRPGNILEQGIWFYDVHNKIHRKVTSFLPLEFLLVPQSDHFVFVANNRKIYRAHIDGTGAVEIPFNTYVGYDGNLKPFLDK